MFLPTPSHQKVIDHKCKRLFLHPLIFFIDICLSLCSYHTVLILLYYKFWNWKVYVLKLCSSSSIKSMFLNWTLFLKIFLLLKSAEKLEQQSDVDVSLYAFIVALAISILFFLVETNYLVLILYLPNFTMHFETNMRNLKRLPLFNLC